MKFKRPYSVLSLFKFLNISIGEVLETNCLSNIESKKFKKCFMNCGGKLSDIPQTK